MNRRCFHVTRNERNSSQSNYWTRTVYFASKTTALTIADLNQAGKSDIVVDAELGTQNKRQPD